MLEFPKGKHFVADIFGGDKFSCRNINIAEVKWVVTHNFPIFDLNTHHKKQFQCKDSFLKRLTPISYIYREMIN